MGSIPFRVEQFYLLLKLMDFNPDGFFEANTLIQQEN